MRDGALGRGRRDFGTKGRDVVHVLNLTWKAARAKMCGRRIPGSQVLCFLVILIDSQCSIEEKDTPGRLKRRRMLFRQQGQASQIGTGRRSSRVRWRECWRWRSAPLIRRQYAIVRCRGPAPPFWSGSAGCPSRIEFWHRRPFVIHSRRT
jgi:hypothetical protein